MEQCYDMNINLCHDGNKMDRSYRRGWDQMYYRYSNFSFTRELMAPGYHSNMYEHGRLRLSYLMGKPDYVYMSCVKRKPVFGVSDHVRH